jgi:replication factor A1
MKISELQPKQGNADVAGEIAEVGEARTFNKFGKEGKVANAVLKDESGQVKLTLWNEQTGMVKQGDRVAIKNGYVGEWQGEMQLSTGKFGTLEVLPSAEKTESKKEEETSVEEEEFEE